MATELPPLKASILLQDVLAQYKAGTNMCTYICPSISMYTQSLGRGWEDATAVRIKAQIFADMHASEKMPSYVETYDSWLQYVHDLYPTRDQKQEARIQWLEALITYYQQQGD